MKTLLVLPFDEMQESPAAVTSDSPLHEYHNVYVMVDNGTLWITDETPAGIDGATFREAWAPGTWARAWRVDEPPKEG